MLAKLIAPILIFTPLIIMISKISDIDKGLFIILIIIWLFYTLLALNIGIKLGDILDKWLKLK